VFAAVLGSVAQSAVDVIDTSPQLKAIAERLGGSSGLLDTRIAAGV
jgi:hypothetical protein